MRQRLLSCSLLLFILAAQGAVSAEEKQAGHVSGRLQTKSGTAMKDGLVYFFTAEGPLPTPEKYWRIPDFLGGIKDKGVFTIDLPEGEYYFGAIKRVKGKTDNGPPKKGDFFYKAVDSAGKPALYTVKKGEKLDLGTISGIMPFRGLPSTDKLSGIEGRVVTPDGKPVAGALVFAFTSESMIGKPLFASYKTGKDGKYLLRVHEAGNYFLRARDIYGGGPPIPGAIIGAYGGQTPEAVAVRTGEITKGIDIPVQKFAGRGQQGMRGGPQ